MVKKPNKNLKKIETSYNEPLANLIPIIYGAIFSYAFYILTKIGAQYYDLLIAQNAVKDMTIWQILNPFDSYGLLVLRKASMFLILYFTVLIYMVEDIGAIIKLERRYPFRRTTRYTYEMVIGMLYISTFYFMQINILVALIMFTLVIISGGLWTLQLGKEYPNNDIYYYARTMKQIHFVFGFLTAIILTALAIKLGFNAISWTPILIFIPIFLLMELCAAVLPVLQNGKLAMELGVNVIVPDRLIKKIANWQRKDLNL